MKIIRKSTRELMLCGLMLCIMMLLAIPSVKSEAASKKPTCVKNQTVYANSSKVFNNQNLFFDSVSDKIYIKNLKSNAKITNIKSSNKNIKAISGLKIADAKFKGIQLQAYGNVKLGDKSKISFKVKQNGKTYALSCTITIKKEPARFAKISIGGKNYASKVTGLADKKLTLPKNKKVKISIKMKPGMKLTAIYLYSNQLTKIKNGQSVKLKKGDQIQILFQHTKKPKNYLPCLNKNLKDVFLNDSLGIIVK